MSNLLTTLVILIGASRCSSLKCFHCNTNQDLECAVTVPTTSPYYLECEGLGAVCYYAITIGYFYNEYPGRTVDRQCLERELALNEDLTRTVQVDGVQMTCVQTYWANPNTADGREDWYNKYTCYCKADGCNGKDLTSQASSNSSLWRSALARTYEDDRHVHCFECSTELDSECADVKLSRLFTMPNYDKSPFYRRCSRAQRACFLTTIVGTKDKANLRIVRRGCQTSVTTGCTLKSEGTPGTGNWQTQEDCVCTGHGCNGGDHTYKVAPHGWRLGTRGRNTPLFCFQCSTENDKACAGIKLSPFPMNPNPQNSPFYKRCTVGKSPTCSLRTALGASSRLLTRECVDNSEVEGCREYTMAEDKEYFKGEVCTCGTDGCNGGDHTFRMEPEEWKEDEEQKQVLLFCYVCDTETDNDCGNVKKLTATSPYYKRCAEGACRTNVTLWETGGKLGKHVSRSCEDSSQLEMCYDFSSGDPAQGNLDWNKGRVCLCRSPGCNGLDFTHEVAPEGRSEEDFQDDGQKRGKGAATRTFVCFWATLMPYLSVLLGPLLEGFTLCSVICLSRLKSKFEPYFTI